MNYQSNNILEKKLPPFSGLVLVLMIFAITTWLTGNVVIFGTKAATGGVPQQVQVTNLSDTSFTVTYKTDSPVFGSLNYGTDKTLGKIGFDDRDKVTNKTTEHYLHHITINDLTPGTKYIFEITSGDAAYKNNDTPYEVITAPKLTSSSGNSQILKGQVTLEDGSIPIEGIAQVATDTSQTLTVLLKQDGSYEVPLKSLRSNDLSKWETISENTRLHVKVSNPSQIATADLLASQSNPAPPMILSKNYDFLINASDQSTQATGSAVPDVNLPVPVDTTQVTAPKISIPRANQKFTDGQPRFEGKAVAGNDVGILIELPDQPLEATVQTDTNGNWEFRPELPLEAGNYKITIRSLDSDGTLQTVNQSFSVLSEGSQFVEPSISPALIVSPEPAPSSEPLPPIPSVIDTPTPTITPIPTLPLPSISGDGNGSGSGQGNGNPPVPNSGSPALLIGFLGILISAGIGTFLFLFI